jgi:uncharacterized protein with von Willebrand factor type A (vWA) domain
MGSMEQGKSSQWIEQEQVETGLSALQQLAKNRKKGFSLFDAIATMMPGIEKSFAAGYTHQEICETLKEKAGIAIAPSTLKLYINRIKKEKEQRKGREVKPKAVQKQAVEEVQKAVVEEVQKTAQQKTAKQKMAHYFPTAIPKPDDYSKSKFVKMPDDL